MNRTNIIFSIFILFLFGLGFYIENSDSVKTREVVQVKTVKKPDFTSFTDVKQKKTAFFTYFNKLAIIENNKIKRIRKNLIKYYYLDPKNDYIHSIAKEYRHTYDNTKNSFDKLLSKVDIIPPSLVLAQAASESAWGTSRFSLKANNFFGEWCFERGCGIVPLKRGKGQTHEVRKFNSPQESISAYMKNLNSHKAYKSLRDIRAKIRKDHSAIISGVELAYGLENYSSRKEDYIKDIVSIISYNKLEKFDRKVL